MITYKYSYILDDCNMKDKKAAKKIIKRAKKHPRWYTEEEVRYAKMVRRKIKREEREEKEKNVK
tara:strand:+ start:804 stop:995 length:192 start_codon:yes stop_codon:yes gene_type:complete